MKTPLSHPLYTNAHLPRAWSIWQQWQRQYNIDSAFRFMDIVDREYHAAGVEPDIAGVHAFWSWMRWQDCGMPYYELDEEVMELLQTMELPFRTDEPAPELPLPFDAFYVAYPSREDSPPILNQHTGWHRSEGFYVCRNPVEIMPRGYAITVLATGEGKDTPVSRAYRAIDDKAYTRDDATAYGNIIPGWATERWKQPGRTDRQVLEGEVWWTHARIAAAFLVTLATRGVERILTQQTSKAQAFPKSTKAEKKALRDGKRLIPATVVRLTQPEKRYVSPSSNSTKRDLDHLDAVMRLRRPHIRKQWMLEKTARDKQEAIIERKTDDKGRQLAAVYINIGARPARYYVKKQDGPRRFRVKA